MEYLVSEVEDYIAKWLQGQPRDNYGGGSYHINQVKYCLIISYIHYKFVVERRERGLLEVGIDFRGEKLP